MTLVARIRQLSLVLAAVSALVAPVLAGERMSPGCDEAQAKSRSIQPADASAPAAPAARGARTSVNPPEDVYAPRPARATTPRAAEVSSAPAAPVTPAPASPARRRESATTVGRAPRPAQTRAKVSMRNLPAAPGMGTLLRVGVTAGREISWFDFVPPTAPRTAHSGRAPPRVDALAHPAPAALPGAPPTAANIACAHLSAAPPRSTSRTFDSPETTPRPGPRDRQAGAAHVAAKPVSPAREPRARVGSGAARSESTPAQQVFRLSGGFTA